MKTKIISQNSRSWPWQPKMTELLGQTQVGRAPLFHARSTISRLKIWKGKILRWAGWRGRIFLHRPERHIQKSHSKLITTKGGSLRTACSGESVSPLKSTRGALPVINSPLQPLFSLFSNHPSAAHCSRLSHTFSCTGRKNYINSHFYIYFSFEKDMQTNNLKKSFIRMMISLTVVVITFLSVQHLHRRHLFHLHNSVAQYIRKKVVKRTMGDTTLLRQWQWGIPRTPSVRPCPTSQPPFWTHSAPVSLTMPGHLSHCFLMLLVPGGCGVHGRLVYGGGEQGRGLWLSQFPVSSVCGDFSHFALRVQRVRGRNPFACLLKLPASNDPHPPL